jgi:hypothetical protein
VFRCAFFFAACTAFVLARGAGELETGVMVRLTAGGVGAEEVLGAGGGLTAGGETCAGR